MPALWNIASQAGLTVGVVNWLMTQPPERVRGVMISDHAAPGALKGRLNLAAGVVGRAPEKIENRGSESALAYPAAWAERFRALESAAEPLTGVPNPFADRSGPIWERLALSYERDTLVARAALAIEAETRPELLLVYLNGVDPVSHLFWASLEPLETVPPAFRTGEAERLRQRQALHAYYRYADALVGRLVARYGPNDLVLVVSDHGFELARPGDVTPGVHFTEAAIDGIAFARGRGVAPGSRIEKM
ncbi:MAG: alkaline phosphatase family protein, partial [Deltaproteobacteria bacterium]|nr:alkaline phosphatase family protein [Deltaproteobacteria bacterium]